MRTRSSVKLAVRKFDEVLSPVSVHLASERGTLLSFVFHGLFKTTSEIEDETLDPQQGITVEMFRRFIGYFQRNSYRFIAPEALIRGLSPKERYVLLTFDDGYYNNVRAVPVLEEFEVPAVFFISSDHVRNGKAFWWDVVFRELKKRGKSKADILKVTEALKRFKTADVESKLRGEFGEAAMTPLGDLDRPFTPAELSDFARHRLVHLGNHTKDHAILTNYSAIEVKQQIEGAQEAIREMTGNTPQVIAYPNGDATHAIRDAARAVGLQLGMIARGGKNRLPLGSESQTAMSLKRFQLWGESSIESQCLVCRSDLSLFRLLKGLDLRRTSHSFSQIPLDSQREYFANTAGS